MSSPQSGARELKRLIRLKYYHIEHEFESCHPLTSSAYVAKFKSALSPPAPGALHIAPVLRGPIAAGISHNSTSVVPVIRRPDLDRTESIHFRCESVCSPVVAPAHTYPQSLWFRHFRGVRLMPRVLPSMSLSSFTS